MPFSFAAHRVERPAVPCWITYTNGGDPSHHPGEHPPLAAVRREDRGQGPPILPVHRGQGRAVSPSASATRSLWSPRAWARTRSTSTAFPLRCRRTCRNASCAASRDWKSWRSSRPGYAVEYDFLPPTQLFPSLMTKSIEGLFVAGQTNGTSGYEEAAAQGLMAGINAALYLQGREPSCPLPGRGLHRGDGG